MRGVALLSTSMVWLACVDRSLGDDFTASAEPETERLDVDVRDAAEAMAGARCDAWFGCECDAIFDNFSDRAQCEASIRDYVDEIVEHALASGLQYEPSCVAVFIALYSDRGCASWDAAVEAAYAEMVQCPIFRGVATEGERCDADWYYTPTFYAPSFDTCARDLDCVNGRCAAAKGEGEPCTGACAHPLFCDVSESTPRCRRPHGLGEHCESEAPCATGVCEDEVCVEPVGLGELCSPDQCGYGACTLGGICVPVPSAC